MTHILQVKNPYNQKIVGEYPIDTLNTVATKIAQLKQAQLSWCQIPLRDRIEAVQAALSYFNEHRQEIALDISQQMGRPISQSPKEIDGLLERANYLCSIAEDTLTPQLLPEKKGYYRAIQRDPLGIVFIISAWNYPLLVTINSLIPSLIAGNTVLLKHSSQTPAIGHHFEKAFQKMAGITNLLQQVIIDHAMTGRIIEQFDIHHVVFTGSVKGGQEILQNTAKKFMQPQLELGGKDAAYIDKSANIESSVASVIDGAMFNSGQSCCGIERAYVHQQIYEQFIQKSLEFLAEYQLGDPLVATTNFGPLISQSSAEAVDRQVQAAVQAGAKILAGGRIRKIDAGFFYEPTLMIDVKQDMAIMQEENFAPILPIISVNSLEQAIDLVNDSTYGLTAAIYTQEPAQARIFADRVRVGTVFMNRCDYLDPALPWTGVKNSGCGSALSHLGFLSVTRAKALHFKEE